MKNKNNAWLLWILLIFLPPVGIIYMWITKKEFTLKKKGTLTIIFAIWLFICMAVGSNNNTTQNTSTNIPVQGEQQSMVVNTSIIESTEAPSSDTEQPAPSDNANDIVYDFSAVDISFGEQDISNLTIKHGELLSVIYNDGTVIVKAKINSSYNNNATIIQNYFNVTDLVKNHGFNTCERLEYWAVADMANGEESKCISFTVDKKTIKGIYKGNIIDNQLGEYVSDLWILPSLKN